MFSTSKSTEQPWLCSDTTGMISQYMSHFMAFTEAVLTEIHAALQHMPGTPLWQMVRDMVQLMCCILHSGKTSGTCSLPFLFMEMTGPQYDH